MGIVPVSFRADEELSTLQAFAEILPHFDDPLIKAMMQRYRSFDGGALEYVGRGGIYAVFCQSSLEGEDAIVSTIALVDAMDLDAMAHGRNLQPAVSFTSFVGTSYPGIQAILTSIGEAVANRIAQHEANPGLAANFDWCVAIERRAPARAVRQVSTETILLDDIQTGRSAA